MYTRTPNEGWSESQANDLGAIDYDMKTNQIMSSIRVLRMTDKTYQVNFYDVNDLAQLKNAVRNVSHTVDEALDHTIVKIYAVHVQNDKINELIDALAQHKQISNELAVDWHQSVKLPPKPTPEPPPRLKFM